MVVFNEVNQQKKLKELREQEAEQLAQMLSVKYGIKYVDLTSTPINLDALRLVDEKRARAGQLVPFNILAQKLDLAVLSPNNPLVKEITTELEQKGYQVRISLASPVSLEFLWSHYKDLSFAAESAAGALEISDDEINAIAEKIKTSTEVGKLLEDTATLSKARKVSHILEIIMAGGLATNASDVHMEPEETYVRIRYRLDGVLTDVYKLDNLTFGYILSRIKLLSGLKLNVHGTQDGRFSIRIQGTEIEIRTSILPGAYNESIVMRILNPKSIGVQLEELGIGERMLDIITKQLRKPNGMILTTGPTGSGKTTALYAFLRKIHTPDIKIITIENPVEYHLPGIVQTQTDPEKGYNFLAGLRAALRQDPDVIMVGEIRDNETAEIAVNAALTGHLVFSTLHTNNAAGTFPRLIDLGVNPKILTSAINIAMAQRLTRKLCEHCKKEKPITDADKMVIQKHLAGVVHKEDIPQTEVYYEAVGCEKCNHSGYKGRIGIYEAILADEAIEKVLQSNPSEREIAAAAHPQGINTMEQDGIIKVLKGITSMDELERVVDLDSL